MVAEHWPVTSANTGVAGAMVSWTMMFCVWVDSLPWPSLKCQVTTDVPCVERVSESLVVPVTVPAQLSVVVGAALMVAEHWPVTSGNTGVAGGVVSWTMMFWVAVVVLPFPSSNVQ